MKTVLSVDVAKNKSMIMLMNNEGEILIDTKEIKHNLGEFEKVKEENITCNTALEQFYEDKEYIYYFPCEKSKYVIVIYSNGYQ